MMSVPPCLTRVIAAITGQEYLSSQPTLLWFSVTLMILKSSGVFISAQVIVTDSIPTRPTSPFSQSEIGPTKASPSSLTVVCESVIDVPIRGKTVFRSPNYPSNYPPNSYCTYYLIAQSSYKININSYYFHLEDDYKCSYDSLSFYENDTQLKFDSPFCGENDPKNLLSTTNKVKAVFVSDNATQYNGFYISVQAIDASSSVPQSLITYWAGARNTTFIEVPAGGAITFHSPDYRSNYPPNTNYIYNIITPTGYQIKAETTNFYLESTCTLDSLTFYDIMNESEVVIQTPSCGHNNSRNFQSVTNRVKVVFHTYSVDYNGFNISSRAIGSLSTFSPYSQSVNCGGVIDVPTGERTRFQTPNFPYQYPRNTHCIYYIIAKSGHRINITSMDFFLISDAFCYNKYLNFYENDTGVVVGPPFCGENGPMNLLSATNKVNAVFHSDTSTEFEGFRISVQAIPDTISTIGFSREVVITLKNADTEDHPANDFSKYQTIIIGSSAAVAVLLAILVAALIFHHRKKCQLRRSTVNNTSQNKPCGSDAGLELQVWNSSDVKLNALLSRYVGLLEVERQTLEISNSILGKGSQGVVYKGVAYSLATRSKGRTTVAVKVLIDSDDHQHKQAFAEEITIMAKLGRHVNVVNILGVVLQGEPLVILEYCQLGSLLSYLRGNRNDYLQNRVDESEIPLELAENHRKKQKSITSDKSTMPKIKGNMGHVLSADDLMLFSHQISRGMEYLSSRSIIHRDLAARNVLISEQRILKISDFGLAKQEKTYTMDNLHVALPILWLSPEAILTRTFSQKSDVWSFGILLWEIFSLGDRPFVMDGVAVFSANAFAGWLMEGNQMTRSSGTPMEIDDLMRHCWDLDPGNRPKFSIIRENLDLLTCNTLNGKIYLTLEEPIAQLDDLHRDIHRCFTEAERYLAWHGANTLSDLTRSFLNKQQHGRIDIVNGIPSFMRHGYAARLKELDEEYFWRTLRKF